MRHLIYYIAASLDGFIAREDGSFSEFPWDEEFGRHLLDTFPETFPTHLRQGPVDRSSNREFDAVVMGRNTYEVGLRAGLTSPYSTLDQFVVSRTLEVSPDPAVEVISTDPVKRISSLKQSTGGSIWLCGGGHLASTLVGGGLIDRLIVKLNPIVLGSGIPLFRDPIDQPQLVLTDSRAFPSGHVWLEYDAHP